LSDLIVVTGTSGGLGRAIAARALADGYRVVGIARRPVTSIDLDAADGGYAHIEFDL
jgi:3-oxoacyl-[acyl-carrier protein] reductase